ncbi:unnamed protein product [Gongylonema pulchrum]|uniref:Uncharacterized protein n=1 Tax=Gongylonema pulchrum TaxID=637853 RepID=A0A183ENG5_9BILA|nr:unnamed protein product [Gongylonema pulchrum]
MESSAPSGSSFRDIIVERLERRNRIYGQFEAIFTSSKKQLLLLTDCELADYVANLARAARAHPSSSSIMEGADDRAAKLEAKLADLYRKKEQNDQQLIEANNRLRDMTKELNAITIVLVFFAFSKSYNLRREFINPRLLGRPLCMQLNSGPRMISDCEYNCSGSG